MQFFTDLKYHVKSSIWHKALFFKGRASRKEFVMFMLFYLFMGGLLFAFERLNLYYSHLPVAALIFASLCIIWTLFLIALLIPLVSLTARRLHDLNISAYWLLTLIILPLLFIIVFFICLKKGSKTPNRFGSAEP